MTLTRLHHRRSDRTRPGHGEAAIAPDATTLELTVEPEAARREAPAGGGPDGSPWAERRRVPSLRRGAHRRRRPAPARWVTPPDFDDPTVVDEVPDFLPTDPDSPFEPPIPGAPYGPDGDAPARWDARRPSTGRGSAHLRRPLIPTAPPARVRREVARSDRSLAHDGRSPGEGAAPVGRLRMDPRFAARWTQVRREAGRRRLRLLIAAGAAMALLLAGAVSLYLPWMSARHVIVTGSGPVRASEIIRLAHLEGRPPLISINSGATAARLDAVPQLGGASVARQWPSTVRVRVLYRTAVASVTVAVAGGMPSRWALVDATGRVLQDSATPPSGIPVIFVTGPLPAPGEWLPGSPGPKVLPLGPGKAVADLNAGVASADVPVGISAALAVAAAMPASLRGDVLSISAQAIAGGAGGTLSMTVLPATMASGSIPVNLGDGSQLATKLTAVVTLLTQADLTGATGIDVSVPNRPAVLTAR